MPMLLRCPESDGLPVTLATMKGTARRDIDGSDVLANKSEWMANQHASHRQASTECRRQLQQWTLNKSDRKLVT